MECIFHFHLFSQFLRKFFYHKICHWHYEKNSQGICWNIHHLLLSKEFNHSLDIYHINTSFLLFSYIVDIYHNYRFHQLSFVHHNLVFHIHQFLIILSIFHKRPEHMSFCQVIFLRNLDNLCIFQLVASIIYQCICLTHILLHCFELERIYHKEYIFLTHLIFEYQCKRVAHMIQNQSYVFAHLHIFVSSHHFLLSKEFNHSLDIYHINTSFLLFSYRVDMFHSHYFPIVFNLHYSWVQCNIYHQQI